MGKIVTHGHKQRQGSIRHTVKGDEGIGKGLSKAGESF